MAGAADFLGHHGRLGDVAAVDIDERKVCLLYTSDAADERSSVDLGGRRIIKKKNMRAAETHIPIQQQQYT